MADEQRHRRLRLLIKKLNKDRKEQAQKIDMLCNDLIGAQREFIKKLNTISFVASFYESIVGTTDLNNLLYTAVRIIKAETDDATVILFLRESADDLRFAIFDWRLGLVQQSTIANGQSPAGDALGRKIPLEACFTPELMDGICRSNKVCTLEDMFAMGLQGNLTELNKISAVAIPLGLPGSPLGFMLLYRSSQNKLSADEIERVSAVTYGLSRAIASCQSFCHKDTKTPRL